MDISTLTFDGRDEFKRKSIAEKVISLLQADIDISPMVIDGSWGTGKTEFCHKLINLMRSNDTHHLIYIDAFKADHADDPLMTVLAEVIKVLPDETSKQSFMKKALPAMRYGFKASAKAVVSHVLKQDFADVVDGLDKEIQGAADKAIDATVESVLKDHIKAEQNLKALQTALTEIAAIKPIILFVDELDRCRPNFAVDMLEIIKHTFDVKGVNFVLVTNTQQLKASVNHCYGHEIDAQRYLDKFVKFRFELSSFAERNIRSPILAARKHFVTLAQEKKCLPNEYLKNDTFIQAIEHLIQYHSLSLREVETLILHIQVAQNLSNSDRFVKGQYIGFTLLRLIGVMLVFYQPELLRTLKKGNVDANLLGEFLGVKDIPKLGRGLSRPDVFEIIMAILAKDCNKNTEKYIPQKEQEKEWNMYIHHGIMGGTLDANEAINEIVEIANIMAFE